MTGSNDVRRGWKDAISSWPAGFVANAIVRCPVGCRDLREAYGLTSLLYLRSRMSILWWNVVFGSIGGDWCPADLT